MNKIKAQVIEKKIDGEDVQILRMGFKSELKIIDETDDRWIIEGYASVFGNIDSHYEVVDKGAFLEFLAAYPPDPKTGVPRFPKFVADHDWARPLGPTLEAREDEIGLYVRGELLKDVQDAREKYALIKSGAQTDLSFGFRVREDWIDPDTGVRHLKKIDIYEWSPVLVGSNPKATITNVKSLDGKGEGDDCVMDDGSEGTVGPDGDGSMVCMPKMAKTDDPENPPAPTGDDEGKDAKSGRVLSAKNRKIVEAAVEAMQNSLSALEALLEATDESESASSETEVDQRGKKSTLKLLLKDARRADQTIEKIILRAKKL